MYSPPPPITPVSSRQQGLTTGGPLVAICCLGLILFLIAATIILALIPIYLPTKNATLGGTTQVYYFVLTPNVTLGNDGTLSPAARAAIANAIAAKLGFVPSSLIFIGDIVVATSQSKRRRRGLGLIRNDRATGSQKCYGKGNFQRSLCKQCVLITTVFTIAVAFFYGGVLLVVQFVVTILLTSVPIPPTLGSSTSSTTLSATTAPIG